MRLVVCLAAGLLAFGCGSRGPLDDFSPDDAGPASDAPGTDGSTVDSGDPPTDGGGRDVGPIDGGPTCPGVLEVCGDDCVDLAVD